MSANLAWKPVIEPKHRFLSDALKFKLRDRFSLNNGPVRFDAGQIAYLQGLLDCDIEDASLLIAAIEKHGEVEVYLVY